MMLKDQTNSNLAAHHFLSRMNKRIFLLTKCLIYILYLVDEQLIINFPICFVVFYTFS